MNKIKYLALLLIILIFCNCNIYINNTDQNSNRIITRFNGIDVKLKNNVPLVALTLSLNDYQIQLNEQNNIISKNTAKVKIDLEQLNVIYNDLLSEVNYDIFEYNNDENIILQIKDDFPDLNDAEITENIDTIKEIYAQQLRYQFYLKIKDIELNNILSKGDYPEGLTSDEFWLLFWNPWQIDPTSRACTEAREHAKNKYFVSNWGDRSDAMRHAIWNVLLASYVGGNKAERLDWATRFSNAHETGHIKWADENNEPVYDWDQAMDYHNNEIGRSYFKIYSSEKDVMWWKEVTIPDLDRAVEDIYIQSQNGIKFYTIPELATMKNNLVFYKGM